MGGEWSGEGRWVEERENKAKYGGVWGGMVRGWSVGGMVGVSMGADIFARVVSCPDPTWLTRGEGVWCHKSKSLGQWKY